MYLINSLKRNVLITFHEVLFHAPTNHTLDERIIIQNIIIAEERFIRQALSSPLYEDILAKKNVLVTTDNKADLEAKFDNGMVLYEGDIVNATELLPANYLALWNQFLWKLTAETVAFVATPEAFIQMSNAGIIHKQPQSSPLLQGNEVTPGLNSTKWVMDKKLMDRIDPLIEAMQYWICEHKADYPLYAHKCACDDPEEGISVKRKTSYVFGIYDDDEPKSCCDG